MSSSEVPDGVKPPIAIEELRSYGCTTAQAPALLRGIAALRAAGLAEKDIVDAIYSSTRIFDALRYGNHEEATRLALSRVEESKADLRASGVPEDILHELGSSGLAVGEIAWAIRNIVGLRDLLLDANRLQAKQQATALHNFFFRTGRSSHAPSEEG